MRFSAKIRGSPEFIENAGYLQPFAIIDMNNPYAILFIVISLILFGVTSLMIFRDVKRKNYDLVNTIGKNTWWGQTVDIGKYYQAYQMYYKYNGRNLVLIMNIVSYPAFVISIFWLALS